MKWRNIVDEQWSEPIEVLQHNGTEFIIPDAEFDTKEQYEIMLEVTDDAGYSTVADAMMFKSFITMDFLAGGHGIAFGGPATEENFTCHMDAVFKGDVDIEDVTSLRDRITEVIGVNVTGGVANDTREFWRNMPNGIYYFNELNMLNGQPGQWCYLENMRARNSSDIHQILHIQANGASYHRGADSATTAMPGWTLFLDSTNGMRADNANGYWGLARPSDGNTSEYIRTTVNGLIPYQSGGSGNIGTSGWPFNFIYTKQLVRAGSEIKDHVRDSGTSGIWHYIKWENGIAMCWANKQFTFNGTAWGYNATSAAAFTFGNLPFTFTAVDSRFVSCDSNAWWAITGCRNNNTSFNDIWLVSASYQQTSVSNSLWVHGLVIGRWK